MRDSIGAVSYVEFVLHPAPMFEKFVEVADKILDAIQPAGGAQASEPQQQVRSAQHSVIVCHNIFVLAPPLEDPQPAMQPAAQCRLKHSPVWLHWGGVSKLFKSAVRPVHVRSLFSAGAHCSCR